MGQPELPEEFAYMRSLLAVRQRRAKGVSLDAGDAGAQRPAGRILGAGQVGSQAPRHEDRHNPLLFKINMGAGHGGRSGRYEALRDEAFRYAFVLERSARAESRPRDGMSNGV